MDFDRFLYDHITFPGGTFPFWIFYPVFGSLFALCAFGARSQVMVDVRADWNGASRSWVKPCMLLALVKCTWCVLVVVGPHSTESNVIKVCYRLQS